jgi:hypothetical protein
VRQVHNEHGNGLSVAHSEDEVARAPLAFDAGPQAPTEVGTQSRAAARRFAVPAFWGAVLVGSAVALFAVARLARRRRRDSGLFKVVAERALSEGSLARTAGAALARLAIERLLSSVSVAANGNAFTASVSGELPGTPRNVHRARLDSSGVQGNSTTDGLHETIG